MSRVSPLPGPADPLLSVTGLRKRFWGVAALDGADIEVPRGSITGLIGPNGAGKSTLLNVVSGLVRPDGGQVRFDGADVTGTAPQVLAARGIARTFQTARGFPRLTVFQHLMLFGREQPGERLAGALMFGRAARAREAALAERAFEVAQRLRLTRVLDNPVTALSGGQKKLVEIGRTLMADARLILLDEPMAGVNPTLGAEIAEHLERLNAEGLTLCLIEHDMPMIRRLCSHVVVLAEGRTLTSGAFERVAADHRVIEAYLGTRHFA